MIDIVFAAPIVPRGQPAPRAMAFLGANGKPTARTFQPKDAAQWKSDLRTYAQDHQPGTPIDEPVRLDILAVLPRPQNRFRKKDPSGLIPCTSKPDADNIRKAVQDALNKVWWRDDALIVCGQTLKVYAEKDGHPRLVLRVRTLPNVHDIATQLGLNLKSNGTPAVEGELGDLFHLRRTLERDDELEREQDSAPAIDDHAGDVMSEDELAELTRGGDAA